MRMENGQIVGRFAPTPSGQMHLGNLFAGLLAWLSVRSQGGKMILRMEDLDAERCREAYADSIRRDLLWLGLDWDEETQPQSQRGEIYQRYFAGLGERGLLYPCYCTRSQLHAIGAPHSSDGTYVYPGTCRDLTPEAQGSFGRRPAWRVRVPDETVFFTDGVQGAYQENLLKDCGDFVVRRADGIFVYQLAVVVDDGLAGVSEVVRGADLLGSVARQMYLQELFGFSKPLYYHVPMALAPNGRRLSKRDGDLSLSALRQKMPKEKLLGFLGFAAGLLPCFEAISVEELTKAFSWEKVARIAKENPEGLRLPPELIEVK